MTEQQNTQIDALAGQLVTHQRCLADLSVEDRQWAFQNPKVALALFCDAVKNRAAKGVEPPKPTLVFRKMTMLGATSVMTYGLGKRQTIAQMLRALLKLVPDAPLDEIEMLAKERRHGIPSSDYENILAKQAKFFFKQDGGEDFGLRGDSWANLILVQYDDGSLSVAFALWGRSRWLRYRYSLDFGHVWSREYCLVVSNSDASDL